MAKEGEGVQARRKAAMKDAEDWQVARKVEGLRAEGEKVISQSGGRCAEAPGLREGPAWRREGPARRRLWATGPTPTACSAG